jgi:hypothetical protein
MRKSSECRYVLSGVTGTIEEAPCVEYRRKDYLHEKEPIDYIVWLYTFDSATAPSLAEVAGGSARGTLVVEARHEFGERTAYQEWVRYDTAADMHETYTWTNEKGAAVLYDFRGENGRITYRCTNKDRSGFVDKPGALAGFSDTLDAGSGGWRRRISGSLDWAGNGSMEVRGIDTFEIECAGDSFVVTPASEKVPVIAWVRQGVSFSAEYEDPELGVTVAMRFDVDAASDSLSGEFSSVDSDGHAAFSGSASAGPFYTGRGRIFGALSDPEIDDVPLIVSIDLWGTNTVEEDIENQSNNFYFE